MADDPIDLEGPELTLEQGQVLSRSVLWDLQRRFFDRVGPAAWSRGTVPQYITTNPFMAGACGDVVLGWLRDWQSSDAPLPSDLPVNILELGGGSGRFAYHFLRRFLPSWRRCGARGAAVRYILTDSTPANVAAWQAHRRLRPFADAGLLDFAVFDPLSDEEVHLLESGEVLAAGGVSQPLAVLANYFFDSIAQDAYSIRAGRLHECRVTVKVAGPAPDLDEANLIDRLRLSWEHHPASPDCNDEPACNELLRRYQKRLDDTVFLLPVGALRCLERLERLAGGRLLLLAGDKGPTREEGLLGQEAPEVVLHGSFSLPVNYHALAFVVRRRGGRCLLPRPRPRRLALAAFQFGLGPGEDGETRQAFARAASGFNPDDFYLLKKRMEALGEELGAEEWLALLRLSGHDANLVLVGFHALLAQLGTASAAVKNEMRQVLRAVWKMYFPLGEESDLALLLGVLHAQVGHWPDAIRYYRHSLRLAGPSADAFFHMALSLERMGRRAEAARCVSRALRLDPAHGPARSLRAHLAAEARRQSHRRRQARPEGHLQCAAGRQSEP
jgi:tetratricopeptide (TPR) repeat protein